MFIFQVGKYFPNSSIFILILSTVWEFVYISFTLCVSKILHVNVILNKFVSYLIQVPILAHILFFYI